MSRQLNQVSSASEPSLLEVLSEELSKRMHIEEDFVWVETAEAYPRAEPSENFPLRGNIEHETSTVNSYGISSVVQPNIDCNGEISDKSDCSSDYQEDEDLEETEYHVNQCIKDKIKPFNHVRLKYRQPFIAKIRDRGVYSIEKKQISNEQNEKKKREQRNKLPLGMKFNAATTAVLEMLIINKYFKPFNELIYNGRNSVIFHAYDNMHEKKPIRYIHFYKVKTLRYHSPQVVVKIYKTSKDEEKNEIIYKRVQKEFEHLQILMKIHWKILRYQASTCPVTAQKNVIVMTYRGCKFSGLVDPTIENVPHKHDKEIYNSIIYYMDIWYNIANLVHGNLSVKNILLYWNNIPYIVGWSHSVKRHHPLALIKLMKDCRFVTEFYKERGVQVKSATDLFKLITRQEIIDDRALKIVQGEDLFKKYKSNPNRKTCSVKPRTNRRFN